MPRYFWFNILLLLFPCLLLAQTVIEAEWLTIEDGLSQGFVPDIMQDRDGFLWIATKNGLNRYDGKHFKVFTHDPADPYSISDDYVLELHDFDDFILVGTQHPDLNLFHKRTNRFYKLPIDNQSHGNSESNFQSIVQDGLGQVWTIAGPLRQLYRLRFPDDFQSQFPLQEEILDRVEWLQISGVNSLDEHPIAIRNDTLLTLNPDSGQLWKVDVSTGEAHVSKKLPLPDIPIGEVQGLSNGKLTALGYNELYIFKDGNWNKIKTDFECHHLHNFKKEQQVWIATNQGFLVFEENDLERNNLNQSNANFIIPYGGTVARVLETDKSGNIWAGSYGYGVLKISPRQFKIRSFWKGSSIYSRPYLTLNDDLYIANSEADGALILLDQESTFYDILSKNVEHITETKSINNSGTTEIGKGLRSTVIYDPEINSIFSVYTHIGLKKLYQYDIDDHRLIEHDFPEFIESYVEINPYSLAKTTNGQYWIGTNNGLIHASLHHGKFVFERFEEELNGLHSNEVASLLKDPVDDHILWIGTKGAGLHRLDTRDMSWRYINSKNGLPNDVIYGVLNDDHGNLWMSSNKGIIRYNPLNGDIKNFTKADGLQGDEFNTYAYAKAPDGRMIFGGVNGLNIFHPDDLQDNPATPKVQLTRLSVNNEAVTVGDSTGLLSETIPYTSEITLPFSQNSLTLQFAALEFTASSKNRFRYYLEGAEKEWVHESTVNKANYLNLSPGAYTFKIKGANGDGIWSDEVTSLTINILPP